jgi:hypothetical protein
MEMTAQKSPEQEVAEARKQRVSQICDAIKDDIKHWEYAFDRMKNWRAFARGLQWKGSTKEQLSDPDRLYVANITMRHLKQRTASIYAKNPTYQWRRSKRLYHTEWDGTASQLQVAMQLMGTPADTTGQHTRVVQEAIAYKAQSRIFERVGETASALYGYFIREQQPPAKAMMKRQVLASLTDGVAYFKQTFQRAMGMTPDQNRALEDHKKRLEILERLSAELAEDEFDEHAPEMEQLRALMADIEAKPELILREGIAVDYPDGMNIIPEKTMTHIQGFIGCSRVTEQYCLTCDQVREVYGVDVKEKSTKYRENDTKPSGIAANDDKALETVRVWEVWDKAEGMTYTVCDGYDDYLVEPHSPVTYTERFWPWFVYAPNAVLDPSDPFPPSDVELMMAMQMEINRAGQALADHRWAARPGHVTGVNIPVEDANKMEHRRAHEVITLASLKPEERIEDKFQPFPASPIDPNLYNTGPAFQDILRSVGTQEANLGGSSGSTATESSIAESSRQSTLESAIDEFDDLLTEMARSGGQILMQEMSEPQVKEILGPGALWPEQTRDEIAREVYLEVVAGSSGRPNQAQEVQVRERVYPLLFQLPGIKHEMLAKDLLKVLDDGINYEDWIDMDALPVQALNGQMQASANRGGEGGAEGDGQGDNGEGGGDNAPNPPEPGNAGPARPGQQGFGPMMGMA